MGSSLDDQDLNVLSQPIRILTNMMISYANWNLTNPSSSFKLKVCAIIDAAFLHATNHCFAKPYKLWKVNLGMEILQLQLKLSVSGSNGLEAVNANGAEIRKISLIPLEAPYNAISRGTWLKALRALTSKEINSSRSSSTLRSVKTLVFNDEEQWITPSNAAFRILQRLVTGKGVRNSQQIALDERDFNMVLHAYATLSQNRMHAAHRVMALQERTDSAPPLSAVAYSILLKAYGRWKDMKNVEMSILHAKRNGVVPDIVMVNSVLDAYVDCGFVDMAREIFLIMTEKSNSKGDAYWPLLRPNSRTFNILLKGMAEQGNVNEAMELSKIVESKGLWDDVTTNTLVKVAVKAEEFQIAEDILSKHTTSFNYDTVNGSGRRGDHPNIEAYTELVDGYAKAGFLENALGIMQLMLKREVEPNEYTYTCIVGALARSNKVRQARKMIEYALKLNLPRKRLTPIYNAFISGLLSDNWSDNLESVGQASHAGNVIEALSIFQEMQELNIRPNVVTVSVIIDGLGRCNPPRCQVAKELVQHLEFLSQAKSRIGNRLPDASSRGISLSNKKIATALIRAYGRGNDVESAIEAFRMIPDPDVVALNTLLDACCRCDKLKVALELFGKYVSFERWNSDRPISQNAEDIAIRPDVVTFTTVISSLLQLKSKAATKRARTMYRDMKQTWMIHPDKILVDTILSAMISGGPIGFSDDDLRFTLAVLRDGEHLEWEGNQYERRKRAVRAILVKCSSEVWKNDDFAFGLMNEDPEDPLFTKKGWNTIDSGFRLWGGGEGKVAKRGGNSSVDSFLASKGWNDMDSGFRLL
jgi:pentatricopeptide repeat protein